MSKNKEVVLVTGGCGFIASHLVTALVTDLTLVEKVILLDALQQGSNSNLIDPTHPECEWKDHLQSGRLIFVHGRYGDRDRVRDLCDQYGVTHLYHLAASTHVEHSYRDPEETTRNNVMELLEMLRGLQQVRQPLQLFFHMSTDEVLGDLNLKPADENTVGRATNYYAASKAAAEQFVWACHYSYGLPVKMIRANNVYGEGQVGEKVFELFCRAILEGKPLQIHGTGTQQRNWLYVKDTVHAILLVGRQAPVGEIYHIGSNDEISITDLARRLFLVLSPAGGMLQLNFVRDRPHNDAYYHIDWSKLRGLGWNPLTPIDEGIQRTALWYRDHFSFSPSSK